MNFDFDRVVLGYLTHIVDRLDAIEAKLDVMFRGGVSDEQYRILMSDIPVREKAEKLGKSVGWVSKWVNRLRGSNHIHEV